jgi:glycosyltransferase involved in cell wall biosynthesis
MFHNAHVTAVIPALNEEGAIGKVVSELYALTHNKQVVVDHVVVCDNGSTDNTSKVAMKHGATVVLQPQPGYGIACLTAIAAIAKTDIILFVDGDDSCVISQALPLLQGITSGDDLAIGSRVLGNIQHGALTPAQSFGNWLSARLIRLLWSENVTDLGPFRAIRAPAYEQLNMQDKAFGWTVEMQIKAIQWGLKINEYPVDSKVRIGQSKISGTLKGTILAGIGILSKIAKLRIQQKTFVAQATRG